MSQLGPDWHFLTFMPAKQLGGLVTAESRDRASERCPSCLLSNLIASDTWTWDQPNKKWALTTPSRCLAIPYDEDHRAVALSQLRHGQTHNLITFWYTVNYGGRGGKNEVNTIIFQVLGRSNHDPTWGTVRHPIPCGRQWVLIDMECGSWLIALPSAELLKEGEEYTSYETDATNNKIHNAEKRIITPCGQVRFDNNVPLQTKPRRGRQDHSLLSVKDLDWII